MTSNPEDPRDKTYNYQLKAPKITASGLVYDEYGKGHYFDKYWRDFCKNHPDELKKFAFNPRCFEDDYVS